MSSKRFRKLKKSERPLADLTPQRKQALGDQKIILQANSEDEKMSAVLLDFIEPYVKYAPEGEAFEKLLATACVGWNAALMPEEKQRDFLRATCEPVLETGGVEAAEDFISIVKELIERKLHLFPDNDRFIVDYRVAETKDGFRLSITSTL